MATIKDPLKVFNWRVEVDGLLMALAQKCTMPEPEIDETEHGDVNMPIKTPGRIKFSDIVIEKLKSASLGPDNWAWNWMMQAQTPGVGGDLPQNVMKTLIIREMAPDNITAINTYQCELCWVKKIAHNDKDRNSSDNVLETVTLCTSLVKKK